MHFGRLKYFLWMLPGSTFIHAQVSYPAVDSASYSMYLNGDWKALHVYGKKAIASGIDYPLLRMRIGYADYMRGNFSSSEKNYRAALKSDSHNQAAIYFLALDNENLNRNASADYYGKFLDDSLAEKLGLKKSAFITSFDAEGGMKFPQSDLRQNASVFRVGMGSQLSWRWSLYQSVNLFGQDVYDNRNDSFAHYPQIHVGQKSYYARLNFQANAHLGFEGAFQRISLTNSMVNVQQNPHGPPGQPPPGATITSAMSIFLGGIHYSFSRLVLYGEFANTFSSEGNFSQVGFSFLYTPLGNFNLYLRGNAYYQMNSNGNNILLIPTIGFRPMKKVWLESGVTIGTYNNLIEGEGIYFLNMFDDTKFRSSSTLYIALGKKVMLNFNFTEETKQMSNHQINYKQSSITGGLSWKL